MAEIDMTTPTVAPKVGGYGVLRNGLRVGPMYEDKHKCICAWINGSSIGWGSAGNYIWNASPHANDLITITPDPDNKQEESGVVKQITYVKQIREMNSCDFENNEYKSGYFCAKSEAEDIAEKADAEIVRLKKALKHLLL